MTALLFERPVLLCLVWLAVQIIVVACARARPTPRAAWAVWIGLGALPLLLASSILVVTTRERIVSLCDRLAEAVAQADVAAVHARLAADFQAEGVKRDEFLPALKRTFALFRVVEPRLYQFEVTVSNDSTATAEFNASCFVTGSGIGRQRLLSRWRLTFEQRGRDWLLVEAKALPRAFSPIRSVRDCLR